MSVADFVAHLANDIHSDRHYPGGEDELIADAFTVTPESFGAKGDGVTHDSVNIQVAIDHVANAGGGTVKFTSKKYIIDVPLILDESVVLIGNNSKGNIPNFLNAPTLQATPEMRGYIVSSPPTVSPPVFIHYLGVHGLALMPGTLKGIGQGGVEYHSAWWSRVTNCFFGEFGLAAVATDLACVANGFVDLLGSGLNDTIPVPAGVFDIDGTDHYLARCEINGPLHFQATSVGFNGDIIAGAQIVRAGLMLRASTSWVYDINGEFCDVGVYVAGGYNRFMGTRSDNNPGHGFVVIGSGNSFVGCHALSNSTAQSNKYDGFVVTSWGNSFVSCIAAPAGAETDLQRYGFRDLVNYIYYPTKNQRNSYIGCSGKVATDLFNPNAAGCAEGITNGPLTKRPPSFNAGKIYNDTTVPRLETPFNVSVSISDSEDVLTSRWLDLISHQNTGNLLDYIAANGLSFAAGQANTIIDPEVGVDYPKDRIGACHFIIQAGANATNYVLLPSRIQVYPGHNYSFQMSVRSNVRRQGKLYIGWQRADDTGINLSDPSAVVNTALNWGDATEVLKLENVTAPDEAAYAALYFSVDGSVPGDVHTLTRCSFVEGVNAYWVEP